jgi:membrane-associated phospholipid phosphatase
MSTLALLANLVALLLAMAVRGAAIDAGLLIKAAPGVVLLAASFALRRQGHIRGAEMLAGFSILLLVGIVCSGLSYLVAASDLPLRDAELMAADRYLGLDFSRVLNGFLQLPRLMLVLNYAYASFEYQILLTPLLVLTCARLRAAQFVLAWSLGLTVTVAIFPFVPALGGYLYSGVDRTGVPEVLVAFAWNFGDIFLRAREGTDLLLGADDLTGMVTFPSFHAFVAVLVAWACWPVRMLRWPALTWNALMFFSSIPIGGHYAVDLIAGGLLACAAALAAVKFSVSSRGGRLRLAHEWATRPVSAQAGTISQSASIDTRSPVPSQT